MLTTELFLEDKKKSRSQRKREEFQAMLKPIGEDYIYSPSNQPTLLPLKDRIKILKKISRYTIKTKGKTTPALNPINCNQQRSKCVGDGETVSKPLNLKKEYSKGGELDLQPQDTKRDNTNVQLPYKDINFRKAKSQYTKSTIPTKIFIKDDRVVDGVTGNPVKSNMRFTGNYDTETIQEIIDVTRRYNDALTKEGNTHLKHDIPTVLSIALQETNLGNKYPTNPMHFLYKERSEDITSEGSIINSLNVLTEAKRRGIKLGDPTEAHIIQRYNSYDLDKNLTNKSEYGANSYYGVPTPINLRDNPVYGKRVINLRDSVLMKNKRVRDLIGKSKYQYGGKIKTKQDIDSTYLANKNVPFIKRILDGNKYSIPFGKGYATHRMAYSEADGKHYVYPEVEYYDGKLTNLPDINVNPFDYNFKNKNVIGFDSKGDAKRFTKRYKRSSYWKP